MNEDFQSPGRNKPFQAQNIPSDAKISENILQYLGNLRPFEVLNLRFFWRYARFFLYFSLLIAKIGLYQNIYP